MRIHTNILLSPDFFDAAVKVRQANVAPEVYLETCERHGSRSRDRSYEVALRGVGKRHTRRPMPKRSGRADVESGYAATYDDWGWWLSALFDVDGDLIAGPYKGAEDFHARTHDKYVQ